VVSSKTEWGLTVLTIDIDANSRWRCDFDMVIPSYMGKETALLATETNGHDDLEAWIPNGTL
jgi:hypothetical protein